MPDRSAQNPAQCFLGALDAPARLHFDDDTEGWILSIGDAEQSHVDLNDPRRVFYEYLRRIANVVDLAGTPGAPLRAIHLGGGAMTLPRYIAATRPGSPQTVVELARELPDFVMGRLPLPPGSAVEVIIGDAREELPAARAGLAAPADVVVLDVFRGADAPQHLRDREFYAGVRDLLGPEGILLVNVGDDPGLQFLAEQARMLGRPAGPGSRPLFEDLWCLTEHSMLSGTQAGNLILVASTRQIPPEWGEALRIAGPHPAAVLDRWELEEWLESL